MTVRHGRPGDMKSSAGAVRPRSHSAEYRHHVEGPSPEWNQVRGFAAIRAGGCCEGCGSSGPRAFLTTAHLTYAGGVIPRDLDAVALLCSTCHHSRDKGGRQLELAHRRPAGLWISWAWQTFIDGLPR